MNREVLMVGGIANGRKVAVVDVPNINVSFPIFDLFCTHFGTLDPTRYRVAIYTETSYGIFTTTDDCTIKDNRCEECKNPIVEPKPFHHCNCEYCGFDDE